MTEQEYLYFITGPAIPIGYKTRVWAQCPFCGVGNFKECRPDLTCRYKHCKHLKYVEEKTKVWFLFQDGLCENPIRADVFELVEDRISDEYLEGEEDENLQWVRTLNKAV